MSKQQDCLIELLKERYPDQIFTVLSDEDNTTIVFSGNVDELEKYYERQAEAKDANG